MAQTTFSDGESLSNVRLNVINANATDAESRLSTLESDSVFSVNSGTDITIDTTDPQNPIINYTGTAGGVTSWNTRTGDVLPIADDYAASEVTNDSDVIGAYVDDALNTLDVQLGGNTLGAKVISPTSLEDGYTLVWNNDDSEYDLVAPSVPTGGTARQALTKIDGTDYNTEFKSNWYDYSTNVEYTGVETAITSGTVYTCSIDGGTIYRFVNSTNNANGYPTEDSFYTNFDGSNLTNLIVTRG